MLQNSLRKVFKDFLHFLNEKVFKNLPMYNSEQIKYLIYCQPKSYTGHGRAVIQFKQNLITLPIHNDL